MIVQDIFLHVAFLLAVGRIWKEDMQVDLIDTYFI